MSDAARMFDPDEPLPDFQGATYVRTYDLERLTDQIKRIVHVMCDQKWRTVAEIAALTGDPQESTGAQLRNLRKDDHGRYPVTQRKRGSTNLSEYQLGMKGEGEPKKVRLAQENQTLREHIETLTLQIHQRHNTSHSWRKCYAEPCLSTRMLLVK